MVSPRDYELRMGLVETRSAFRQTILLPLVLVLAVAHLLAYRALASAWPTMAAGIDLSLLSYFLPAAREAYVFFSDCGEDAIASYRVGLVFFNLFLLLPLDVALVRCAARIVPLYKQVENTHSTYTRKIARPHFWGLLLALSLTCGDFVSPEACAAIGGMNSGRLPLYALATVLLAVAACSVLQNPVHSTNGSAR